MANELGDVLAALHRAPRLTSFEAEGQWFIDTRAFIEFMNSNSSSSSSSMGRTVRMQAAGAAVFHANGGPDSTDLEPETFRVWFREGSTAGPGASRWRVQSTTTSETVVPNDTEVHHWTHNQASVTIRDLADSRYPTGCGPLLAGPSFTSHLTIADSIALAEHAGRPCWHITATRRPDARPAMFGAQLDFPGTTVEAWVDQETGALLRCFGNDTKRIFELDVHRFEPGVDIDDAVFAARRPDDHPTADLDPFREPPRNAADVDVDAMTAFFPEMKSDPIDFFAVTGPPPDDEEDARLDIGLACQRVFTLSADGEAMPYVLGGENLGPVTRAARKVYGTNEGSASVEVVKIKFTDRDQAAASLLISVPSIPTWPSTARIHRTSSGWKVGREFIAKLYAMLGIYLPPPEDS